MKLAQYKHGVSKFYIIVDGENIVKFDGFAVVSTILHMSQNIKSTLVEKTISKRKHTPLYPVQLGEDFEKLEDFDSIFEEFLV